MKKFNYFYKTTNIINEKFYYGVHSSDKDNDNYLGSGKLLLKAIKKYGRENFKREIIQFFDSFDDALNFEKQFIIEDIITNPLCYNINIGGKGGSKRGRQSPMKGRLHSEETKIKISNSERGKSKNKGITRSIETRQKISENNGMKNRGYLVSGSRNGMYKKKYNII